MMSFRYKRIRSTFILITTFVLILNYKLFWRDPERGNTSPPNSTKCIVPKLEPFHPSILHLVRWAPSLNCHVNDKYPFYFNSSVDPYPRIFPARRLHTEYLNETHFIRNCSYQTVNRKTDDERWVDFLYRLEPVSYPVNLDQETVIPQGHDFIAISCKVGRLIRPAPVLNQSVYLSVATEVVDMHAFIHDKREEKVVDDNQSDKLNVILLGIDSVSRMSFLRDFKESYKYLMDNLSAVEMTAYHKMGDNTFPSVIPMLTNLPTISESKLDCEDDASFFDNCPFIWERFKDAGYQTLYAEDEKKLALFNLDKRGFKVPPTDYYFRPYISAADTLIGHVGHPPFRSVKSCFGPRPAFQVMLDYMQKMSYVMTSGGQGQGSSRRKYFQYAWASSNSHDNLSGGRPWDGYLRRALEWWNNGGYLSDTVFILLSDHGIRWGKMHGFYQGQLEDRLPFMYIVVPPRFRDKYPEKYDNLMKNKDRLITTLDVHQTLVDILVTGNSSIPWRQYPDIELTTGVSLFQEIPETRTCETAGIEEAYCTCNHQMNSLPISNNLIQLAANFAVYHMNKIISRFKECAYLTLDKIIQAAQVSFADGEILKRKNRIWAGYQLSFQTTPGSATFEAFVFWDKIGKWAVSGQIGRTNRYGNQSHCVVEKYAKLYCFCLDFLYNNFTIVKNNK